MTRFVPPLDYPRIKVVSTFQELVATPFEGLVNAICWQRALPGDFDEVVSRLVATAGIAAIDEQLLLALPVSALGKIAIDILLNDQRLLSSNGHAPQLNCIHGYPRDEANSALPTDVYSFHVDSATVPTDTFLCSYNGPASEGLRNDEGRRRVDIPAIRAQLLARFAGPDDAAFSAYLAANFQDLHYTPDEQATPFSFGTGNLWRIAVSFPGCPVLPFIHRAPKAMLGQSPRLLLIS
jgi:hypothetical protein